MKVLAATFSGQHLLRRGVEGHHLLVVLHRERDDPVGRLVVHVLVGDGEVPQGHRLQRLGLVLVGAGGGW